jgi:hypothetical protein
VPIGRCLGRLGRNCVAREAGNPESAVSPEDRKGQMAAKRNRGSAAPFPFGVDRKPGTRPGAFGALRRRGPDGHLQVAARRFPALLRHDGGA